MKNCMKLLVMIVLTAIIIKTEVVMPFKANFYIGAIAVSELDVETTTLTIIFAEPMFGNVAESDAKKTNAYISSVTKNDVSIGKITDAPAIFASDGMRLTITIPCTTFKEEDEMKVIFCSNAVEYQSEKNWLISFSCGIKTISDEVTLPIISGDSPIFTIDYKNHQLIVPTGTNTSFFLGAKDKKGVVKTYELFEARGTSTKIPLSSFANTKEWKLKLYGNIDNIPADITLTAGAKKVKAVYAQTETTVSKRIKFTNDGTEVEIDKLEYRTAGSQWLDASMLTIEQLDAHAVYGATLFFRIKAVEDSNPYSKETKMKIPKKANAPKVKIDYSKLTAKFPANTEYRIKHSDTWTAAPTAAVNLTSITNISTTHFYLEVRKAAVNGKAASKIAITTVDSQQPGPSISTTAGVILLTNEKANGVTTSVKLKNTSEKAIEYAIVAKDTDINSINTASQKWKKLAKGAEVSLKKKDSDEKIIIARYAAITTKNETPQFASKITKSTTIMWVK